MHVDADVDMADLGGETSDKEEEAEDVDMEIKPMPPTEGIEALRAKLHAKMALLRRGGRGPSHGEAGDKDDLLEERRRQRAAMRERRRKETKEKIQREQELKGKKDKDRTDTRDKGNITKVYYCSSLLFHLC